MKNGRSWMALTLALAVMSGGCSSMRRWTLGGPVEEPDYRVVAEHGSFEVRAYGPMVVAETEVDGSFLDGGNNGFRTLAGYIFGGIESSGPQEPNGTSATNALIAVTLVA